MSVYSCQDQIAVALCKTKYKKDLKTNYRKYPKKSIQAVCQSLGHHLSREAGWAV